MKSSQVKKIKKEYFLHLREYDVKLFGINAAALLSVIRSANKWKDETDLRNKKANDVAEMHGDNRWLPENVDIRFSIQDLLERSFHICGRNGVIDALKDLETVFGLITIHYNPNKKYKSDKGRYFEFHEEIYARLRADLKQKEMLEVDDTDVEIEEEIQEEAEAEDEQYVENTHGLKLNPGEFKNKLDQSNAFKIKRTPFKIKPTPFKNKLPIKNSNNKYKNNKNTNNKSVDKTFSSRKFEEDIADIQPIMDFLITAGFPAKCFQHPDAVEILQQLHEAGATVKIFSEAYQAAILATKKTGRTFNLHYLAKIIEDRLNKNQGMKKSNLTQDQPKVYESHLTNGLDWLGNILKEEA